jgi:glycosyltransferase involved in cell wall biosynthesis
VHDDATLEVGISMPHNTTGPTRPARPTLLRAAHPLTRPTADTVSIGMLGTYPPTQCGLASFAGTLRGSLLAQRRGTEVGIVRMVGDGDPPTDHSEVVYDLRADARGDVGVAAAHLNRYDVVIVQHEYGIYGGTDGAQVLEVLGRVRSPIVMVLHTVLSTPTPGQRQVLEQLVGLADTVVTLSRTGHLRLRAGYQVDDRKLVMIPHGAWLGGPPVATTVTPSRPVILTWGLLGPGKGLEWGVEALPALRDLDPMPRYVVAGQTHPRVLARDGERYRDSLRQRAAELAVTDMLHFEPGYLDAARLRRLVARADVVLLPYDSHEQVTSGVLIEALGALKPVVSTAFPHARELLAEGAGTLVPHANPQAISAALRRILTEPAHAAGMVAATARIAPSLRWPAVADRYLRIADELGARRAVVA